MIELCICGGILLGLIVGMYIGHAAREERDQKIAELEGELTVKRNVCESNNATISRLRKENERLKKTKEE